MNFMLTIKDDETCEVRDASGRCCGAPRAECSCELTGRKKGHRCGMLLCRDHMVRVGAAVICPPHARKRGIDVLPGPSARVAA